MFLFITFLESFFDNKELYNKESIDEQVTTSSSLYTMKKRVLEDLEEFNKNLVMSNYLAEASSYIADQRYLYTKSKINLFPAANNDKANLDKNLKTKNQIIKQFVKDFLQCFDRKKYASKLINEGLNKQQISFLFKKVNRLMFMQANSIIKRCMPLIDKIVCDDSISPLIYSSVTDSLFEIPLKEFKTLLSGRLPSLKRYQLGPEKIFRRYNRFLTYYVNKCTKDVFNNSNLKESLKNLDNTKFCFKVNESDLFDKESNFNRTFLYKLSKCFASFIWFWEFTNVCLDEEQTKDEFISFQKALIETLDSACDVSQLNNNLSSFYDQLSQDFLKKFETNLAKNSDNKIIFRFPYIKNFINQCLDIIKQQIIFVTFVDKTTDCDDLSKKQLTQLKELLNFLRCYKSDKSISYKKLLDKVITGGSILLNFDDQTTINAKNLLNPSFNTV